jgi:hypothetical protein
MKRTPSRTGGERDYANANVIKTNVVNVNILLTQNMNLINEMQT